MQGSEIVASVLVGIFGNRQDCLKIYSRTQSFSGILFNDTDALARYTFMLANVLTVSIKS